jgi:hypothetical protein
MGEGHGVTDRVPHSELVELRKRLAGARSRCANPTGKNAAYAHVAFEFASPAVGARLVYDKLGPIPPGASLDRIEPSGPYALGNLRYASPTLQSVNRRVVLNGWRARLKGPSTSSGQVPSTKARDG